MDRRSFLNCARTHFRLIPSSTGYKRYAYPGYYIVKTHKEEFLLYPSRVFEEIYELKGDC
jgi:hypothetical protein